MGKRRAIQKALGRLGMQASNQEVVAALAPFEMSVPPSLGETCAWMLEKVSP